ncbi:MAG: hypothetical protein ACI4VH_07860 [Clostridia bacterium]
MKNFSTWMLVMFMIMFWVLRVVVAVSAELNWSFGGLEPLNQQMEIILLFVVLVCIILVVKRKMLGGLIYLLAYGMYFGVDIFNNIQILLSAVETTIDINLYMNLFMSVIGMILPIAVLLDLLMDKNRKNHPKDKKTDWFYDNEQFDRKLDERADKNNYRTL